MTLLADFPGNGIRIDTDDDPTAAECRVALVVMDDEAQRAERMRAALLADSNLTPETARRLEESRRGYEEACGKVRGWMARKGYPTEPGLP